MAETPRTLETLELVGGAWCLDFANTINSRTAPEHDYLMQYTDLVGWANRVELISPAQTRQLEKQARQNREEADHALQTARTSRELMYSIFSSIAQGAEPKREDMAFFVQLHAEALSHSLFQKQGSRYTPTWKLDQAFDSLLWPILYTAGELLVSEALAHLKECPGCGWLFLDTSKNQSRRWCSMNTCGARDKMRRYHKRQRAK